VALKGVVAGFSNYVAESKFDSQFATFFGRVCEFDVGKV
jgi:hypothetical protein